MFHELYPTSEQSKVTPAALGPGVGATEAKFPFGTARRDLSQPQTGCRLCTMALLFCFGQKAKEKKIKGKLIHSILPTQVYKQN